MREGDTAYGTVRYIQTFSHFCLHLVSNCLDKCGRTVLSCEVVDAVVDTVCLSHFHRSGLVS